MAYSSRLVAEIEPSALFDNSDWEFNQPENVVKIKDRLSMDLTLWYTVANIRSLFQWDTQEFVKLCEFASG